MRGHVSFQVPINRDRTPTSALWTGLAELPPAGRLGRHRHTQPEVDHVFEGTGVVIPDGAEHADEQAGVGPRRTDGRPPG